MSKFNAYKSRGNNCPVCASHSGKCKSQPYELSRGGITVETTKVFCMNGVGGYGSPDYHYFGDTEPGGGAWGVYIPLVDWNTYRGDKTKISQADKDAWVLEQKRKQQVAIAEENQRQADALGNADRDATARAILEQLTLNYIDRADLIKRGFTAEQIRTIGFKSVEKWQRLDVEVNNRFPGVNVRGNGLNVRFGGILIPLYSIDGEILGFQLRNRNKQDSLRYLWLSSASEWGRKNGGTPKLKCGENPLTFIRPEWLGVERTRLSVGLAEGTGAKPCLAAIRRGQAVIGAAGGQWLSSPDLLKEGLDKWGASKIDLYLDKEDLGKKEVLMRWLKLHDWLVAEKYQPQLLWANADIDELLDLSDLTVLDRSVLQDALDVLVGRKVEIEIETPSASRLAYRRSKVFTPTHQFLTRFFKWSLPNNLKNTLIAIKSALGTGKTEFLKVLALWAKERGLELLFVGYRNNLLRQTTDRIPDTIHIIDEDRIMLESDYHKALCHHSANLIDLDRMENKILIFDECASVFVDMLTSKLTAGRNPDGRDSRQVRLQHLKGMIESCHTVVSLDAYISDTETDFLQQVRSFDRVHKIENEYQNELIVQMIDKKSLVERAIIEDVLGGLSVLVTATTQKQCENMEKALMRVGIDGGTILRIDSTTDRDEVVRSFFRDPAAVLREFKYQVLIMSPTVESGVSIDLRRYFETHYHFHMGNLGILSGLQFLGRYRDFTAPRVIFCEKQGRIDSVNASSFENHVRDSFIESVTADIELAIINVDANVIGEVRSVLNRHAQSSDAWLDLFVRYAAGKNEEAKFLRELFVEAMRRDGYKVTLDPGSLDICDDTQELMARSETERRVRRAQRIYNAPNIDKVAHDRIAKNMSANEDDRIAAQKYRLTQQQLPGIMATDSYSPDLIQLAKFNLPALIPRFESYFYLLNPELARRDRQAAWLPVVSTESVWMPDRIEKSVLPLVNTGRDLGIHELIDVEFGMLAVERIAQTIMDVPAYRAGLKIRVNPSKLEHPLKLFKRVIIKFGLKFCKLGDGVFKLVSPLEQIFQLNGAPKYELMPSTLRNKIHELSGQELWSNSVEAKLLAKELMAAGIVDGRGATSLVVGAARHLGLIVKNKRHRMGTVNGKPHFVRIYMFDELYDPGFTIVDTQISNGIAKTQVYAAAKSIAGEHLFSCISNRLMALAERQSMAIGEWQATRIRLQSELYCPIQIDAFADISKINLPTGRSGSGAFGEVFAVANLKSVAQTLYLLAKMPMDELKAGWAIYQDVMDKDVLAIGLNLLRDKYYSLFDRLKLAF